VLHVLSAKQPKQKPKDKEKYIHLSAMAVMRDWQELWYAMAEMDQTRYEVIKGTSVIEFWNIFDAWQLVLKQRRAAARNK
jgi:hypothetical protein